MTAPSTWQRHLIAVALALTSLGFLRTASQSTGYVRDEAAYFAASLKIRNWLDTLVHNPVLAVERKDKAFGYNREHPAGVKLLAAISLPPNSNHKGRIPGQRLRWAAQCIAALGVYLLAIVGMARYGVAIGIFCAAAFIALPRVFFHAQLHCFDIAIAVSALAVSQAFLKFSQRSTWTTTVGLGLCFGLALSIKHNALLFPAFLGCAWSWNALQARVKRKELSSVLVRGTLALGIGALVFVLLWPWLWTSPWERWLKYIEFHRQHNYYNMAFLGQNYNQPPLPIAYPWVLTAFTWPLSWVLLVLAGLGLSLRHRSSYSDLTRRIDVVMGLGPIVLIALPSVPIFGGTKHWMTAYPFLCLLMGRSLATLMQRLEWKGTWGKALSYANLGLLLCPALVDNYRSHPHQLAQYAGWMGGPRAAARLGMGRAFWGSMCVPQALTKLDPPGRLFTHDLHPYLLGAYRNDGLVPDLKPGRRSRSKWALHFYEDHFLIDELWTQRGGFGYSPAWVCELDDVPLLALYRKEDP